MSLVAPQIAEFQKSSSWIRRMFEAGIELKNKYGTDTEIYPLPGDHFTEPSLVARAQRNAGTVKIHKPEVANWEEIKGKGA